jgi:hypothetical protein
MLSAAPLTRAHVQIGVTRHMIVIGMVDRTPIGSADRAYRN